MAKKPETYALRYVEDFFDVSNDVAVYGDAQKSVPAKLARLLPCITIGCCFDSHPRIDSVLQKPGLRYGLLENAISQSRVSKGVLSLPMR